VDRVAPVPGDVVAVPPEVVEMPKPSLPCECSAAVLSSPVGDLVVLRVAGEVDLASVAVLDAALDEVLDRRPDHLVVDLTDLTFCSARGFATLARAARTAEANGITYGVRGASSRADRLWHLLQLG
jgi:anti-sigma B factor antagonist